MLLKGKLESTALYGHLATFSVVALISLSVRGLETVSPSENRSKGLAGQIAATTGLAVRSDEPVFVVPPHISPLERALFWREIVFLGSSEADIADLYRAEVRQSADGRLLALRGLKNLTSSPAGDEFQLLVKPPYGVVATRSLGQVRSLTIFDFGGHGRQEDAKWSAVESFLSKITDYYRTGHLSGIGKTTVRFLHPPLNVALRFEEEDGKAPLLRARFADMRGEIKDALLSLGEAGAKGVSGEHAELLITREVQLPKHLILWLVDTVRSFSWIGPGPIEWAEGRFFALQDTFRRVRYSLFGDEVAEEEDEAIEKSANSLISFELPPGIEVGKGAPEAKWPPPNFKPPVFARRGPGEGVWKPAVPDFVKKTPGAPPAFYSTYTRPDQVRPYVQVKLIAMDMRQLELHMVAGHEDPKPTTGSVGTGRIPRRPEILFNVVAAFNGAFKTEHGAYGMMVERDVLLPPIDGAATVASTEDGTTLMGSWPEKQPIHPGIRSFRQNMDPLVEGGVVNPRRRYLWGFTLDEDIRNMNTIRSGICTADAGYLVYAWGEDLTAETLGVAMNAAGCSYGMHLDMNPLHTAFFYYLFDEEAGIQKPVFKAEMAIVEMRYSEYRYVNGAPKDFFFLTLRQPSPLPGFQSGELAQPAPAFVPAVFQKETESCTFLAVDMTRAKAELFPGEVPLHLAPAVAGKEEGRGGYQEVLVDIPLGRWSHSRGQLVGRAVVATMVADRGTLGVDEDGRLYLDMWPLAGQGKLIGDAIQSDWLLPQAEGSTKKVISLGFHRSKWLLVGQGSAGEVARVMKEYGVTKVLSFDWSSPEEGTAVRTSQAMVGLDMNPLQARSKSISTLRIKAAPRFLGAGRLEKWLGKAVGSKEESGEAKPAPTR